ncbi:MAG: alkaline phosphatase family protein [Candidatus Aenigmatarchaeota archaeon]
MVRVRKRVFLIGIPHFDWKLVKIMIKEGEMKNFSRFLKDGSYGEIVPQEDKCSSPVEFTTIVTGVKKEKHGIGYGEYSDGEYLNAGRIYTRLDIKVKPIWDIAAEYGKKVGIYHWLLTWPAKKINGFMVTGRCSQDDEYKTYPKELRKIFWTDYPSESDFFNPHAALMLIKKYDVDLFICMEERTHGPTHTFWKYIFSKSKNSQSIKRKFFSLFQHLDFFLGEIEKKFPEAITIIATDSGNKIREYPIYTLGNETIELTKKLGIDLQFYATDVYPQFLPKVKPVFYLPGKSEKEKEKIKKILGKIKLLNGDRFIKNINWNGDYLSFSFNFHPSFTGYQCGWLNIILPNREKFKIWVTKQTGAPSPKRGVFAIKGPKIKKNYDIGKVKVEDIAPTILYLLNIPIPKWMDGKVIKEVIE